MVLAVGLVVDDAIVVVENVQRRIQAGATDIEQATKDAMAEVRGPIIATTLALLAVFVPVAFIPGLVGKLYNQFALTIAIAVGLSGINSMTMSPALCALLLRPTRGGGKNAFFRGFDWVFDSTTEAYVRGVHLFARFWYVVLIRSVACKLQGTGRARSGQLHLLEGTGRAQHATAKIRRCVRSRSGKRHCPGGRVACRHG